MTEEQPEEVRFRWVPELAENPVDLSEHLSGQKPTMAHIEGEFDDYISMDEFRIIQSIPEGALIEVVMMDEDGVGTVGHAEVTRDPNGTATIRIYGTHYNPEERP